MTKFTKHFSTKNTPQSQRIPGTTQVANSAGGYAWQASDWQRLDRFLVLGTDGGTYYTRERELTVDNAETVQRLIAADGVRVVERIVEISRAGRAPKNQPAIFALAMCAKLGDDATRVAARKALPAVCRTGTHIMTFASFIEAFGGWGRGTRNAIARWYNDKPADKLAYQVVKYQARDGWSNRDLLRLAHPKAASDAHQQIYRWITRGELAENADGALDLIRAFEQAKGATDVGTIVGLIETRGLPREAIPTEMLTDPRVWEALLLRMPMTAMIRNLATMTRVGLLAPMSEAAETVITRLDDEDRLRRARIHPIAVLAALLTYKAGRGMRGQHTWAPVASVIDALDRAFYKSFGNVEPTGKRTLLALDVSGSMTCGYIAGVMGLTPRVASAAMALVAAATERDCAFVGFTGELTELSISPRQRLDDVVQTVSGLPFGATDCAQPMLWANQRKLDIDTFVIYTDSETWCGNVHPAQALEHYRRERGIEAKLAVVGMVANRFTIADPNDPSMLDVVGFDTATPNVLSDFARG